MYRLQQNLDLIILDGQTHSFGKDKYKIQIFSDIWYCDKHRKAALYIQRDTLPNQLVRKEQFYHKDLKQHNTKAASLTFLISHILTGILRSKL